MTKVMATTAFSIEIVLLCNANFVFNQQLAKHTKKNPLALQLMTKMYQKREGAMAQGLICDCKQNFETGTNITVKSV